MEDFRALEAAYRAAIYRVQTDPPIDLSIGSNSAALAALLRWAGVTQAAIVTAYNPGSDRQSADANGAADRILRAGLGERGFDLRDTVAIDPSGEWPDEPGVLVLGIDVEDARVLGRAFGQNAIVAIDDSGAASLVWCRPT
ncbi:MAG: DUF3293 domain-containing protein [Pseudomonadota bacterium]